MIEEVEVTETPVKAEKKVYTKKPRKIVDTNAKPSKKKLAKIADKKAFEKRKVLKRKKLRKKLNLIKKDKLHYY